MSDRRQVLSVGTASLLATVGLLASGSGQAQTTLPAELAPQLPGAQWAGSTRLRFFGFDVYDAQLWVAPGFRASTYALHPLALELTYLRALAGKDIAARSLKEMRGLDKISPEQETRWLAAMESALPDVKSGDRIAGLHHPTQGAHFWFNGQPRAWVKDPAFSRLFFGIWLAESTSQPALRAELLARATP
jgi:hypothetical protein